MTGPVVDELDRHPGAEDTGLDRHPELAQRGAEPLVQRFGRLGAAAPEKLGRLPLAVSAISVNWLTTSAAPPVSSSERSNFPSSFSKMRSFATFSASRPASASLSPAATPRRMQSPGPIEPPGATDARVTRWTTASHGSSRSRMRAA